ncbi:glyoxalase [Nakamurella silvestris]|nr:glyoxalase [Nakamurella silvestris]
MKTPTLGSLLLGSADPERLRRWYSAAFGVTADEFGFVTFVTTAVLLDGRDDVAATNPEPGRFILNFNVEDAAATVAHLQTLDVTWIAELTDRGPGKFATLADPDGNYLQILEMTPEYLESQRPQGYGLFGGTLPFNGFAVDDIPAAKTFYADVLGLDVSETNGMLRLATGPTSSTLVYPRPNHVPATYTVLNFPVPDIDEAVDELVRRGVTMEVYPGFGQDEKGIARHRPKIAWFKDPAGNVLSVLQ